MKILFIAFLFVISLSSCVKNEVDISVVHELGIKGNDNSLGDIAFRITGLSLGQSVDLILNPGTYFRVINNSRDVRYTALNTGSYRYTLRLIYDSYYDFNSPNYNTYSSRNVINDKSSSIIVKPGMTTIVTYRVK